LAEKGLQTYVVCPMVDGGEDALASAAAAESYARELGGHLPGLTVGLLHGKLSPRAKDAAMREFASGRAQVLVATTVIEVGVDVPNAALLVVENAERFGLSQLHQLRGRVGRGETESYCVLFLQGGGETARERAEIIRRNHDGFSIAEADLRLRGPGDFFGRRQHGLPEFALADLSQDTELLELARSHAAAMLEGDPELAKPEHAPLREAAGALLRRLEDTE
jgi:ATP-dependent DNA helicase RecG